MLHFFSLGLSKAGLEADSSVFVSLVFAVILGTVLIEGTLAAKSARFFRVMPRLTIIVGADETARLLAERLIEAGEFVSMIDTNEENCAEAKDMKGVKRLL